MITIYQTEQNIRPIICYISLLPARMEWNNMLEIVNKDTEPGDMPFPASN